MNRDLIVTRRLTLLAVVAAIAFGGSCAPADDCAGNNLQCALAAFENDEHGDLHSVIVIRNGALVAEQYYSGGDRQTLVDVRSAGSVTSLLFGIALDQGAIESLDDPVAKYWLEAKGSAVGAVRLADVLTMRTGLDADGNDPESPGYEGRMDAADDPLVFAMSVPAADEPGTRYRYNLFLTAPGFARIGQIVLDDGIHDGRQVVSSEWIRASLQSRLDISDSDPYASGYGYYWYHQTFLLNGRLIDVSFASGNGGNKIYVIPELDLVVSVMSRAYGQGRGQRRSQDILLAVLETHGAR